MATSEAFVISVGYAKHSDPTVAVKRCVKAMNCDQPRLLLAFCGGKLDPHTVLSALQVEFGPTPVVGGSAAGAIGREGFGYSGFELGLIAFSDQEVTPEVLIAPNLLSNEYAAGSRLGVAVRGVATDDAVVLLLFDSVSSTSPLRLHHASTIVEGFHVGFGNGPVCLLGGGLLTDMNLSGGWVFDGKSVVKHAAMALIFPPTVRAETVIMHGCRPVSTFMEITRIEGAEVYELDGRPALAVIERMLGLPLGGARGQELSLVATLGQKQGDPFAPYDENSYVNRLILRADPETGSVTLFEPDFARGTRVQIMSRDNSLMLESVRRAVEAVNCAVVGSDNLLGLYIDCAGRGSARSGAPIEEAELVLRGFDHSVPLLGFYSGVEIAPFANGPSRPLDWTGVLTVLQRRR
jgi:hypothetical protein